MHIGKVADFEGGGGGSQFARICSFSFELRLITAKTIGECSFFKNKCCKHDRLQNRSDTNLFCSETVSSSVVWFWCFCGKCYVIFSLQFPAQSLK